MNTYYISIFSNSMGISSINIRYLDIGYGYWCDTHTRTQYPEIISLKCMTL